MGLWCASLIHIQSVVHEFIGGREVVSVQCLCIDLREWIARNLKRFYWIKFTLIRATGWWRPTRWSATAQISRTHLQWVHASHPIDVVYSIVNKFLFALFLDSIRYKILRTINDDGYHKYTNSTHMQREHEKQEMFFFMHKLFLIIYYRSGPQTRRRREDEKARYLFWKRFVWTEIEKLNKLVKKDIKKYCIRNDSNIEMFETNEIAHENMNTDTDAVCKHVVSASAPKCCWKYDFRSRLSTLNLNQCAINYISETKLYLFGGAVGSGNSLHTAIYSESVSLVSVYTIRTQFTMNWHMSFNWQQPSSNYTLVRLLRPVPSASSFDNKLIRQCERSKHHNLFIGSFAFVCRKSMGAIYRSAQYCIPFNKFVWRYSTTTMWYMQTIDGVRNHLTRAFTNDFVSMFLCFVFKFRNYRKNTY